MKHDLLRVYPVLAEKSGEYVAQFKTTVALLPTGPLILDEVPFEEELYVSEYKIEDPEIQELLAQPLDRKKAKKAAKEAKKEEKNHAEGAKK